jgi:hypothetical protein
MIKKHENIIPLFFPARTIKIRKKSRAAKSFLLVIGSGYSFLLKRVLKMSLTGRQSRHGLRTTINLLIQPAWKWLVILPMAQPLYGSLLTRVNAWIGQSLKTFMIKKNTIRIIN